jgi:hypothetical protein
MGAMLTRPNTLQWDGGTGHYEVYYVTVTDPETGVGLWIRYTMVAPLASTGEAATCALWFLAMDPRAGRAPTTGRKATFPVSALSSSPDPFSLRIGDATLTDASISGAFEDVCWDLRWTPAEHGYEHVHPLLRRAKVAQTVLVLPHADVAIDGSVTIGEERIELAGARGGQAHLWGSKHAQSWAWVHCNDFQTPGGEPATGAFIDAVSVIVQRFGREVGPNTPVVARIDDADFISTSPRRVIANPSKFDLGGWRFEAVDGARKLVCEVDADRERLAGVTYHDPDGALAYCYNGETASMQLELYERSRRAHGWVQRTTLVSPGRAHFEYAQRTPVPDLELLTA